MLQTYLTKTHSTHTHTHTHTLSLSLSRTHTPHGPLGLDGPRLLLKSSVEADA